MDKYQTSIETLFGSDDAIDFLWELIFAFLIGLLIAAWLMPRPSKDKASMEYVTLVFPSSNISQLGDFLEMVGRKG